MKREHAIRQNAGSMRHSSKYLVLLFAMLLAVGTVVGGTVAWLIAETEPVVNTFTYGDIDLLLDETKLDENGNTVDENGDGVPDRVPDETTPGNTYKMLPGKEYLKDPRVTVKAGNEACWLFIKLEEKGGATIVKGDGSMVLYTFDDYLTYAVAEGWTGLQQLDESGIPKTDAEGNPVYVEGVYFRKFDKDWDGLPESLAVLAEDKISVKTAVDKDMLNALDDNGEDIANATYPELSITAYAVQYSGFEAKVSEGAQEPDTVQLNAAAYGAWVAMETQNASTEP